MSAFLGPIHYWVYNKIVFQNKIVCEIINAAKLNGYDISDAVAKKYAELDERPLEDIIDSSNIHGWLQERVSLVEYRFALAVKLTIDARQDALPALKQLLYDIGTEVRPLVLSSAKEAYRLINDLLLDGMPCDGANKLISEEDDQVVWRRNICVHSGYWKETGVDINIYYSLREQLIKGLLSGTGYEFAMNAEDEYVIRRR